MGDNERMFEYIEFIRETAKAYLLKMASGELWYPKQNCVLDKERWTITAPVWLVRKQHGL